MYAKILLVEPIRLSQKTYSSFGLVSYLGGFYLSPLRTCMPNSLKHSDV